MIFVVGSRETLRGIEVNRTGLRQGDRVLLCSDGLYNMVHIPDDAARGQQQRISGGEVPGAGRADQNGGSDNITVILAEVDGPGLSPDYPAASVETVAL